MAPVVTPRVLLKVLSAADVGLRHGGPESAATTVDPYCQVRCGEVILRTAAKTQTTTPEWNQEFKFGVRKPLGDIVKFKVFAFSDVKDELLGEAELTIADLAADETTELTIPLYRGEGSEAKFGTITVEARYEPTFLAEERVSAPPAPVVAPVVSEVTKETVTTTTTAEGVATTTTTVTTTTSDAKADPAVPAKDANYLVVSILEAKGLLALDGTGIEASSDPFVKIHCTKNQSQRTRTQKQTLHPRWRQRFYFYLNKTGPQVLELVVEDVDLISNDFLGRCVIDLNDYLHNFGGGKQVFWLALEHQAKTQGNDVVFSDITPSRKMNLGRGKICLSLETQYLDRKIATLEQGEIDHVTVIPNTRGLRNTGSSIGPDEDGSQENVRAGEDENTAEGDEDNDDDSDDDVDGDDDPLKKETAEEKKLREEEHQKMFQELSDVQFLSGDYQVRVRVIEVRDLKPMDANGLCDPVVSIECLGQRQHTMVKQKQLSCVFDEYLYFNFKNLDKDTIQQGSIKVTVLDADGPRFLARKDGTSRMDDQIGFFVVDIPYVYFQPDHEIHRKWVALVGNTKNNSDSIQGYLLLSIVVLGPGDKLKMHDPSEEKKSTMDQDVASKKDINSMVLIPPRVSQTLHYLVVTVLLAEDLPDMDKSMLRAGGIDAYVRVYFAGQDILETKKVTVKGSGNLNVEFHQELWFPVLLPCMSNNIFVSVWDWDMTTDELVANTVRPFQFSHVQKYPTQFKALWANLYGPPVGYVIESKERKLMNEHPANASTYRGRVLLSMRVEDGSKSVNDRPHTRNLMSVLTRPSSRKYTLRAALFYGTEIPKFPSKTRWNCNSRMTIRVSIGKHAVKSTRAENVGGICHWNQYLDIPEIVFPTDIEQVPDIFVHLTRHQLSENRHICYARYSAKDLFNEGGELKDAKDIPPPQWINLVEDPVLDDLKDHDFTGNVLMSLQLEPSNLEDTVEKETARLWREHSLKTAAYMKYTLFVHVYQGRCLPAADSNGLLDPYVKITCGGSEGKVSTRMSTRDPCFYETVVLDVELPQDQEFLPKVSLQVYDWDQWDADDYVGGVKFNLTDFPQMTSTKYSKKRANGEYAPPRPKWYPICYQKEGDTEGELLLSFDLVKKDTPGAIVEPPDSIRPQMEEKYLEIIALGCRGLQPLGFMPVNTPFVKFEIGEVTKTNVAKLTNPSSKPSGRNPNFLERIVIPVTMPVDALFAPRLNISVYDQLLGGFYKPLIGVCSVDLSHKLRFSNGEPNPLYEESGGKLYIGNPYVDRPDDFSTYPGNVPSEIVREVSRSIAEASPTGDGEEKKEEESKEEKEEAGEEEDDLGTGILPSNIDLDNLYTTGAESEYAEEIPHYMRDRRVIDGTLEEELDTPFETYPLFRGNSLVRRGFFGSRTTVDFRSVGRFKGVVRVLKSRDEPPLFDLESFLNPQPYLVRVYVLDAFNIQPKDENNKCDPYLRLSLGDGHKRSHVFNDRESHCTETLTPKFHNMYEFKAELPGVSELRVELLDYDFFAIPGIPHGLSKGIVSVGTTVDGDDFVGATLLDLEDRWFSSKWQQMGANGDSYEKRKPLEVRPLFAPSSTLPQGSIRLWVDILTPHEIKKVKPLDISLPPIQKFEVRVIVYKAKNVTPGDFTDLSDLLVKCWLQNKDEKAQSTDTHWRAKNGKASFNWRMKFDLELPIDADSEADKGYLHFQMWDKDLLYDDCLADSVVDLSVFLKQAYRTKQIVNVFAKKKSVRGLGSDSMPISSRGAPASGYATSSVYDSTRAPMSSQSVVSIDIDGDKEAKRPLLSGPVSTGSSFFTSQDSELPTSQAGGEHQHISKKKKKSKSSKAKDNAESLVQSVKQRLGMGDDPEDTSWLTLTTRDANTGDRIRAGELLVSIEILPIAMANARAAGLGRSEPNNFPFLPEPADRLHLSAMWNPLYVLEALMGPKFYRAFSSCMVCTVFLALIIFAGPLVNVFLTIVALLPAPFGWIVFGSLMALIFSSFFYCTFQCSRAVSGGSRD